METAMVTGFLPLLPQYLLGKMSPSHPRSFSMRRVLALCFCFILAASVLHADSKNLADYPLRIQIFPHNETNFYHHEYMDETKGEGRADLYENSVAHGVDFSFECSDKVKATFGYETYYAKWKKPGKQLTVLLPVFGKTGDYFTCTLNTDMKDFVYKARNGKLAGQESVEDYKAWMLRTDYDPEHGKNMPKRGAKNDDDETPLGK
jgi:hypothetical protein